MFSILCDIYIYTLIYILGTLIYIYILMYLIYILMYLMLYFVLVYLVYECVLVQMLSARSGVLSFNHLFLTVHMRLFCFGSLGFLSPVPVFAQTQSFCVCKYSVFFYCDDSLESERVLCLLHIQVVAVCLFVILAIVLEN